MIRPATAADCAAIAAIWNPIIRDTAITFTGVEKTETGLAAMLDDKAVAGFPVLVADDGGVLGFATYGTFRNGPGYAQARGRGVGRALMAALEDDARGRGIHSLWAGVSAENPAGRAFHAAIGYAEVAVLPEVGWKFGRWLDLVLMQKMLR